MKLVSSTMYKVSTLLYQWDEELNQQWLVLERETGAESMARTREVAGGD